MLATAHTGSQEPIIKSQDICKSVANQRYYEKLNYIYLQVDIILKTKSIDTGKASLPLLNYLTDFYNAL